MAAEPGKLVLVVDDDEGVREVFGFLARKHGHRVETAADGEDAARKTESLHPDLIVLDLMLPRYGGFELLRHLQAGALSKVPIIVVTGRYTDRSTADLIREESNVVELLEKPVETDRFVAAMERALKPGRPVGGASES